MIFILFITIHSPLESFTLIVPPDVKLPEESLQFIRLGVLSQTAYSVCDEVGVIVPVTPVVAEAVVPHPTKL